MSRTKENIEIRHYYTHNDKNCGRCEHGKNIENKQKIQLENYIKSNPQFFGDVSN